MPYFGNNAPTSDNNQDDTLQEIRSICAEMRLFRVEIAMILLLSAVLVACEAAEEETVAAAPVQISAGDCGPAGFVQTELFGALAGKIHWDATEVICEGMPRPAEIGARLRFAGTVAGTDAEAVELAFIIALPGLRRGETDKELISTVTIIEEGVGRFFSNADQETCWTDILELEALAESDSQYSIRGSLYCVAPLVEVNGATDVILGDFSFRGLLDWNAS